MSLMAQEEPGRVTDALGPVTSFRDAAESAGEGDWVEGGLNVAGGALETLGAIADPLAGVLTMGLGWVLENVHPINDWFDELAGDPDQIKAFAQTWQNVGNDIHQNADAFRAAVDSATAGWSGAAILAYRGAAQAHATVIDGFGTMCQGIGGAVLVGGSIVAAVRSLVVEALAEIVSEIIEKAAVLLSGIGTAPAILAIGNTVRKWIGKLNKFVDDLLTSMGKLGDVLRQIGTAAQDAGKAIKSAADDFATLPINTTFEIENGAMKMADDAHLIYTTAVQTAKDIGAANDE